MKISKNRLPVQPVDKPIICSPYAEPDVHWVYDSETGQPDKFPGRRAAGYWYKTERTGATQRELFIEEERDDLPLVNLLREDVKRWRNSEYRGASKVTRELLKYWHRTDRINRLFFCQLEAVETIIYLAELRISDLSKNTGFKNFALSDSDIKKMLKGERPSFSAESDEFFPTLVDKSAIFSSNELCRLACKMATGTGKTVVMSMLIAWTFCNRGLNPRNIQFPNLVLVCCPNLTVKERLQVLLPENINNYYRQFDIVPEKYFQQMHKGKILINNWHTLALESENIDNNKHYNVVNKGPETPETFARRILGNDFERLPILVFNDEGHHCWRSKANDIEQKLKGDEKKELESESQQATIWVEGLDMLNNCVSNTENNGILFCVDFSATPFYIKGSGYSEGLPFPWIVSDYGLVDAIESGLVKIPRIPIQDNTGRPDPIYFNLWESIKKDLTPVDMKSNRSKKPKPEAIYRKAEGALLQIAGQWVERFNSVHNGDGRDYKVPPVLIIVCDNTEISEYFFEKISGEREVEIEVNSEFDPQLEELNDEEENSEEQDSRNSRKQKPKKKKIYEMGKIFGEYFSNTPEKQYTIRIDSKKLSEIEIESDDKNKENATKRLRQIVSTVGKVGEPGEHIRCVVSVSMLSEGWDANNVTQIMGLRAFGSQLLCEQVVGRGLRRFDYTPDPKTGLLIEDHVDVYGIPFSVIPFKAKPTEPDPEDNRPKYLVQPVPENAHMEIRFPIVEGYSYDLRKNSIKCDISSMEELVIQPFRQPTATFVSSTVGYRVGPPSKTGGFSFVEQNRSEYYNSTHIQTIMFEITRQIVDELCRIGKKISSKKVQRYQSRHLLFPQVFRYVEEYILEKVDFQGQNLCELGLQEYVIRVKERLINGIEPIDTDGKQTLIPRLNKRLGSSTDVYFRTVRKCYATNFSHLNFVVTDTKTWESSAAFRIEQLAQQNYVKFYVRNVEMGFEIPYEYDGENHSYFPDFLVKLNVPGIELTLILEIKGFDDDIARAKSQAAKKWVKAVNNWGGLGHWTFHVCRCVHLLDNELVKLTNKFRTKFNTKS